MPGKSNRNQEILTDYSTEVQDILGHIPNKLVSWGITWVGIIILGFLLAAWLFRYPDMITAPVIVNGEHPPAPVVARQNGRLLRLLVQDGQVVEAGSVLALLENPADSERVLNLIPRIESLGQDPLAVVDGGLQLEAGLNLGELQPTYEGLRRALADYHLFIRLNYHEKKKASLRSQRTTVAFMLVNLERQVIILEEEYGLMREQAARSEEMLRQGVIPQQNYDAVKAQMLQKEYALSSGRVGRGDLRLRLEQIDTELLDLTLAEQEKKQKLLDAVSQALRTLSGQLSTWDQQVVLRAPRAGRVSLSRFWSSSQQVKAGETVMTVVPEGASAILGKVQLPLSGAGKVKPGQRVNLRFTDFPYIEFGTVPGRVRSKSLASSEGSYSVDIELPNGLVTNYGINLTFNQELSGEAEIITDDIRLLTRLFNPLRALFKEHR